MAKLSERGRQDFVGTDILVQPLSLGPPVGRPIQYRLSGPNVEEVRRRALDLANVVGQDTRLDVPTFDWNEPGKVLRVEILQDKARQLGVTSQDIAGILNGIEGGQSITEVRDSIYLVDVVGRARAAERTSLDTLESLQVGLANGSVVPLLAFARIGYELEQPIVWRRDRLPTVTVRATIRDATQPATIVDALKPGIDAYAKALPEGYTLETGGAVEESAKGQGPIANVVPVMLLTMADAADDPVAELRADDPRLLGRATRADRCGAGPAAVQQADGLRRDPRHPGADRHHHPQRRHPRHADRGVPGGGQDAVGCGLRSDPPPDAADPAHRCGGEPRPHPDRREVFWGPMAFAMIGGILAATFLTLLFLPALYVGCYRIREEKSPAA